MAVKAINNSTGPNGIVPTLLIFGVYPKMSKDSASISLMGRSHVVQKAIKEV